MIDVAMLQQAGLGTEVDVPFGSHRLSKRHTNWFSTFGGALSACQSDLSCLPSLHPRSSLCPSARSQPSLSFLRLLARSAASSLTLFPSSLPSSSFLFFHVAYAYTINQCIQLTYRYTAHTSRIRQAADIHTHKVNTYFRLMIALTVLSFHR